MLSRTADHLFWMARYMERAENTARMLDVNYQMSLLPQSEEAAERGWRGMLSINEVSGDFAKRYREVSPRTVIEYMVNDAANGSSIRSCLMAARENARAVRGTLTTEVWETQNQTWLEFQRLIAGEAFQKSPAEAFEWVKFRSHLSRGVTVGTMLQDEAFHFLRIGSFLERADNTARLLDVKFHSVPNDLYGSGAGAIGARMRNGVASFASAGGAIGRQSQSQSQSQSGQSQNHESGNKDVEFDFYHWSAVLRSVSGFEVYRKVYRNVIRPERVAELLILRPDMPRSLAACMHEVVSNLHRVANEQSKDTLRLAGRINADLQYGRIDEILATGLHAYLTQFLERVNALGIGISRDFLVPVA
ncbi:MAG: alpha-E domain-containing protein [Rhizobacter sp.]|nr:alpha-E domain-containing protein [Rhizobacter sp.]